MNKFDIETQSLERLGDKRFIIPTYQRPYVWGENQIYKLIDDFWAAYRNKDSNYFIGTILTSLSSNNNYELIDGQQRFTTLWLIAVAFKLWQKETELTKFLSVGAQLRIDFTIRNQISDYLQFLDSAQDFDFDSLSTQVTNDEYLIGIVKGLSSIISKLKDLDYNENCTPNAFGNYIFSHIKFVKNIAPTNTDLNKLFTTVNNSGLQLEQTDILKSNLLGKISNHKFFYSKVWEACENMKNYFEKNLSKVFTNVNWKTVSVDDVGSKLFDDLIGNLEDSTSSNPNSLKSYSLNQIIHDDIKNDIKDEQTAITTDYIPNDDDTNEVVYCDSILSFPQLLLHSYRIYLANEGRKDFEQPFHQKNLLDIFKNLEASSETEIKKFFKYLWKTRFVFDKYVVKWLSLPQSNEVELLLTSISKNDANFSRTAQNRSTLSMLQSVLYFTGNYNTQMWLSPYLNAAIGNQNDVATLEAIDNILSLQTRLLPEMNTRKNLSFLLMCGNKVNLSKERIDLLETYLKGDKDIGTSFKHYWFQKLEYILWKNWSFDKDEKFKNFRITSKNSIEHIYPQETDRLQYSKMADEFLHSFGNLVLLSVSQNSEYSNKPVSIKRSMFNAKEKTYDTLKSYFIFNLYDDWNENTIAQHQKDMVIFLLNHYKRQTHDEQN